MTLQLGPLGADDVREVARLHRVAFPGFFLSPLGEPFLFQFYGAFIGDPTAVTAVVRGDHGEILGAAVATTEPADFFGHLLRRRLPGLVSASVRAALRHPTAAPRLLRAVTYRGDASPMAHGALLSSIFLIPSARGSGAGRALRAPGRVRQQPREPVRHP